LPELIKYKITTYIIGGLVKDRTSALVGKSAHESLREYHFTKAFIGVNSLSLKSGYTTPDPEEAMIKELAIKNSDKVFVLADSSKFEKNSFCKFGELNQAIIITDKLMNKEYLEKTEVRELVE
jgi:DeoR family fructose operon transcriptional repressor